MTAPSLLIRPSTADDIPAITGIYAASVRHGTGTFEIEAPGCDEIAARRDAVLGKQLPWLVAQSATTVLGYAYASPFRPRPAYRYCVEDSIYLSEAAQRRGIGRLLLAELIARCEAAGARQMLAVIGDSANVASIGVHAAMGFRRVGCIDAAGWKFERWLDVVFMQRALGRGDASAPGP
jgi:L-amino acid N-acyltransferase YncA